VKPSGKGTSGGLDRDTDTSVSAPIFTLHRPVAVSGKTGETLVWMLFDQITAFLLPFTLLQCASFANTNTYHLFYYLLGGGMSLKPRFPFNPLAIALIAASLPVAAEVETSKDAVVLPKMKISADADKEKATGPVQGYVAKRSATATKTNTPVAETPQSISIIGTEQMRDQGALSIQDAMRYVSGVRSEAYGLDSRGDWALVRGTEPVVFLNGTKQTFGYYASSRPDPFVMERIEILKGPASVLYGQSTVGGVVNLASKLPQRESQGEVQVQYGTFERKQINADATGALNADGSLLYRVVAVYRNSDTQVKYVPDDRRVIMPSITWMPNEKVEWTLLADYQKDKTGSTTQFLPHAGTVLPAPNGLRDIPIDVFMSEPGFDAYDTRMKSISSMLTVDINDGIQFRQNLRYAKSRVDYRTMYPSFPPTLQDNGDIERVFWVATPDLKYLTVDNQLQLQFGSEDFSHAVLVGADYQHAVTNRDTAYGEAVGGTLNLYNPVYGRYTPEYTLAADPQNTINQIGIYAQDQISIHQNWLLTLGVRNDSVDNKTRGADSQDDDKTTSRLALMYKTSVGIAPYVSYSESFEPLVGLDIDGDAFKPKKGEQIEVGVKYQPENGSSLYTASIYDLREKYRQVSVVDPVTQRSGEIQRGEARVRGLELEALVAVNNNWDLVANYSYADTEVLEGTIGYDDGADLPSVPDHMASLWSKHRFSIAGVTGFKVGVGARYIGDSWDGMDSLQTPSYTLFDAMLGYEFDNWALELTGTNLEDEVYYTTCLARGDCFVGTRRTVVGSASYRF
jgi:iron complex outermembrane receptor protein